ncbi:MAG TPA: DUF1080 domain-containing protein [Cyclobacteriaceae bacterium]|nr:DUF1080 domain-containing protein [Cyclobacteriaceae bacterium]
MKFTVTLLALLVNSILFAQQPTVPKIDPANFTVAGRQVAYAGEVAHLNAKNGAGFLWLNNFTFTNGTIELDIKGKNTPGQSFVGIAFHGMNNETYEAVYFRPFNFKNPERKSHAVQYISIPTYDWPTLREKHPGKYENTINPVPDNVEEWFHARIVVNNPHVKVYVNGSETPTLEVDQLSTTKQGKLGFWVGNGSEGWFRNLKITQSK